MENDSISVEYKEELVFKHENNLNSCIMLRAGQLHIYETVN